MICVRSVALKTHGVENKENDSARNVLIASVVFVANMREGLGLKGRRNVKGAKMGRALHVE
jgi:hypothetical protein